MATEKIATGNAIDWMWRLGDFDSQFDHGNEGMLDFELKFMPTSDILEKIDSGLRAKGMNLTKPVEAVTGSSHLRIWFLHESPTLPLLAAAIIAVGVAAMVVMIGWALYKVISSADATTVGWQFIAAIAVIVIGVAIVTVLVARKGKMGAGPIKIGG